MSIPGASRTLFGPFYGSLYLLLDNFSDKRLSGRNISTHNTVVGMKTLELTVEIMHFIWVESDFGPLQIGPKAPLN